jgi:hypothetical protein
VLQYHFDNKLGLYSACVDLITLTIWQRIEPVIEDARLLLAEPDPRKLIDCYCRLQDCLIDCFVAPNEGMGVERLLIWENALLQTSDALRMVRERVERPIFNTISGILGCILDEPPEAMTTGLHTFALAGQFMLFQLDGARVFNWTGWKLEDGESAAQLKSILRLHATTLLENLARSRGTWHETSGHSARHQGDVKRKVRHR